MEARSPDSGALDNVERILRRFGESIAGEEDLGFEIRGSFTLDRVYFDSDVVSTIDETCRDLG